jgi:aminoglycoside phosphotransferase
MSGLLETWETHERRYEKYNNRFLKRSLRPREYKLDYRGEIHIPFGSRERLENEAASLQFIKNVTDIPVPTVLEAYEEDESFHLWTELIHGVPMAELLPSEQAIVIGEVERHLETLRGLKRNRVGGPTGITSLPPGITDHFKRDRKWMSKSFPTEEYVFCHNDLSQSNIIVNPDTLQIAGIIDWEFAGFFPGYFEMPFFRDPRPSGARIKHLTDVARVVEFFSVR